MLDARGEKSRMAGFLQCVPVRIVTKMSNNAMCTCMLLCDSAMITQ